MSEVDLTRQCGRLDTTVPVRPSVRLSHSPAAAAYGGFAAVGPAGRRYRLIDCTATGQGRSRAHSSKAGSASFTADVEVES